MSRFWIITLLAVTTFAAAGLLLDGSSRSAAMIGVVLVYGTIVGLGVTYVRWQLFGPAVCRVKTQRPVVALTFDDGPDAATTPLLLDLLKREAVPATFFCIGAKVNEQPAVAARIVDDGHLIANHTQHHGNWLALAFGLAIRREIELAQTSIESATGRRPAYFRPPMGLTNPHFSRAMRQAGVTLAGWDVRSLDTRLSTEQAIERVLRQTRPGSIVLLHDGGLPAEKVLAIAGGVIRRLRERGYAFVRLDTLVAGEPTAHSSLA